jgi:hypothetical protein
MQVGTYRRSTSLFNTICIAIVQKRDSRHIFSTGLPSLLAAIEVTLQLPIWDCSTYSHSGTTTSTLTTYKCCSTSSFVSIT